METDNEKKIIQKFFWPKNEHWEMELLLHDDLDFKRTREYVYGLILDILGNYYLPKDIYLEAKEKLLDEVPAIAEKFLSSEENLENGHRFSTFFAWYVILKLNELEESRKSRNVL